MEVVLTAEQMRSADALAIRSYKIPSLVLMENAGRSVANAIERHYGSVAGKTILVFCGKGNNGGDGFVVARHLLNSGGAVTVVLVGTTHRNLKGDPKTNFDILKQIASGKHISLKIIELKSIQKLSSVPHTDIIVDALLGTGFSGEVRSPHKQVIEYINNTSSTKVSIDVPSGVDATTGVVLNVAVKADLTVTLASKKTGLLVGQGRSYTGRLEVGDISFPEDIFGRLNVQTFEIHRDDIKKVFPKRAIDAHKYKVGKVFVLAGSRGYTGAAAMSAESALRAGAGMVILGCPQSVYPILAKKLTEVIVVPLEETENGAVSLKACDVIQKHLDWAEVVVVGPGLSRDTETQQVVWKICESVDKKLVIDADGLNALSEKISILKKRKSKDVILTPHMGEFIRLSGMKSEEIEQNKVEVARKFAVSNKVTVALKGAPTITATPEGNVYINSTGNAGMATAGVGDVLTGMLAGLWGQEMNQNETAYTGIYLHGEAGDVAKEKLGEKSLLATDILHYLPEAIMKIESGG
jgi:NAD(P)H-hydrate epimerase